MHQAAFVGMVDVGEHAVPAIVVFHSIWHSPDGHVELRVIVTNYGYVVTTDARTSNRLYDSPSSLTLPKFPSLMYIQAIPSQPFSGYGKPVVSQGTRRNTVTVLDVLMLHSPRDFCHSPPVQRGKMYNISIASVTRPGWD